ncbi:MAG: aldehyde dehydrogenase family protein, partial [Deltaproteobacteria bacterium]|nr:aldehyde dehydrogenase family protein [Deltaproteobacteria bacterium]
MSTLTVFHPATGEPMTAVPKTLVEDLPGIVTQARVAQQSWAKLSIAERTAFCDRLVDLLRDEHQTKYLIDIIQGETGTPRDEIDSVEIGGVMFVAQYYRKIAHKMLRARRVTTHPFFHLLKKTTVLPRPRGV